jgi:hypothetical protein
VAVGVVEVDGRRGHPADHARLIGGLAEERERLHARGQERRRSAQHLVKLGGERDVEAHPHRRRPERPQPQHRAARLARPQEGHAAAGVVVGDLEAHDVAIEANGAGHVRDRQVCLEQRGDADRLGGRHS